MVWGIIFQANYCLERYVVDVISKENIKEINNFISKDLTIDSHLCTCAFVLSIEDKRLKIRIEECWSKQS